MASAGPYASMHLAPDRQPRQHPITQFLQAGCPSYRPTNSVKALKAESCWYSTVNMSPHSSLSCDDRATTFGVLFNVDAMDRNRRRKLIKDVSWSGWVSVGECFFRYRPIRSHLFLWGRATKHVSLSPCISVCLLFTRSWPVSECINKHKCGN